MFFCSTFHALSNRKKNIFVSIEMTALCNSTFFQRLLHRSYLQIFLLHKYYPFVSLSSKLVFVFLYHRYSNIAMTCVERIPREKQKRIKLGMKSSLSTE